MMDGVRWTLSETESGSPREARQGGRISVTHVHTCTRMHTQLPVPGRCRKSALGSKVCAQGHVGLRAESVKTRVHILLQMALPYGTPQLWSGRSRGGDRQSRGDPGCLGLSQPASSPVPSRPGEHQHLWVSTQPLSPRSASDSRGRPSRRKATGWQGACSKDSGGNASMDEARSHHPLLLVPGSLGITNTVGDTRGLGQAARCRPVSAADASSGTLTPCVSWSLVVTPGQRTKGGRCVT